MSQRFRLDLEYDGSAFHGWQRQAVSPTVQEVLEDALTRLCGHKVTVMGAGRTDAGVHALGQVAHFTTTQPRPGEVFTRALNAMTPPGVTILRTREVGLRFHARDQACYREYLYRILDRREAPALERGRVWHHPVALDGAVMAAAGALLLGTHDFSAFRAASCQAKHPVRVMSRMEVTRQGEEWRVVVGANSFLHHMVRTLVGSLVLVGLGRWTVARFGEVLASRDRGQAGPTAPAAGLYLVRILYPDEGVTGLVSDHERN